MRLVAWNIRAGGGRRVEGIARQLRRWRPDVVALSEVRGTPPSLLLGELLAAGGLGEQRSTSDPGSPRENALLVASRWPLEPMEARDGPAEALRWLPLEVRAPQYAGGTFLLGAMHVANLVNGPSRKFAFLEALRTFAYAHPDAAGLLAGDTNTGRIHLDEERPVFDARHDRWMTSMAAAGWPDVFRLRHPRARQFTWYSPNGGNGFRLDQAFVSRRLLPRVRSVRHAWGRSPGNTRRDALSDHAALILDFR